ncbi:hypothetical protein H0O00_04455 [Candidatus Micrarchaeota archaeon]|nr:hypothetical protein [Candidatus Micrarchaeota archaeon]
MQLEKLKQFWIVFALLLAWELLYNAISRFVIPSNISGLVWLAMLLYLFGYAVLFALSAYLGARTSAEKENVETLVAAFAALFGLFFICHATSVLLSSNLGNMQDVLLGQIANVCLSIPSLLIGLAGLAAGKLLVHFTKPRDWADCRRSFAILCVVAFVVALVIAYVLSSVMASSIGVEISPSYKIDVNNCVPGETANITSPLGKTNLTIVGKTTYHDREVCHASGTTMTSLGETYPIEWYGVDHDTYCTVVTMESDGAPDIKEDCEGSWPTPP